MKDITLYVSGQFAAIPDETITRITESLNNELSDEPKLYSDTQVKRAVWSILDTKIDDMLEDIEDLVEKELGRMSFREQNRLLGDPEVDIKEEKRLERGDYEYDVNKGN